MVTGFYAALFAIIQYGLTLHVVKRRVAKQVSLGDGKDDELTRRIRAHANFVETVPIALIVMLVAELSGAPYWTLHIVGALLLIGRALHFVAITQNNIKLRPPAMYFTIFSWFAGAALCMWTAIAAMFG